MPSQATDVYGHSAWVASSYTRAIPEWHEKAECRDRDPEAWFPEERKTMAEEIRTTMNVKRVCVSCPVVRECLEAGFADQYSLEFGVWGGSTPLERQAVAGREDRGDVLLAELERQVSDPAACTLGRPSFHAT